VARRQTHAEIEPADVAAVIGATSARIGQPSQESELALRVTQVLTATLGSVPDAAQKLGMSRSVLYETLRRLRIDPKAFRGK
jgi:transcriptional regulator of acetoin/glycerol metabolism